MFSSPDFLERRNAPNSFAYVYAMAQPACGAAGAPVSQVPVPMGSNGVLEPWFTVWAMSGCSSREVLNKVKDAPTLSVFRQVLA